MQRPRKLLTVGHSYVVALNRRLAHEMARVGAGQWEVVVAAPTYFKGSRDLRPVTLERQHREPCQLVPVRAYLTGRVHLFFYGLKLRSLLLSENCWDMVHCWEEPYILAGRQIAWWAPKRTPLVYFSFQNLAKKYPPPFGGLERRCLARSAGWIAAGQTVVEALRSRPGYRDRPWTIIPPGVDTDHFRRNECAGSMVRRSLGWQADGGPPVVGYLGRFLPEKGLPLLLGALDKVKTPWRALFVGSGPLEGRLREWGQCYGDRVRVCTGVTHQHVPGYLNAMNLLCAPSQTTPHWREQFGRMLIEALACEVPVIGSDSGEIPHVVQKAGLIVGEKDEHGWAETIATLLESPSRRAELAACGLERANREFAWPVVARRYLDFFDRLLAERGRTVLPETKATQVLWEGPTKAISAG
jgi:glycosyltransferase involved in cell wall biosynthesis